MMLVDDLVRDELARIHDRLGLKADRALGGDRRAKHVAGGELDQPALRDQPGRLGALARARAARAG